MLLCPALHLSSTSLLLFTFLLISPFPWAWLSIQLSGIEKDNFVDHYCVITVISVNYFSTRTWCWKDAQRAPCSTASVTPAGRLLLTQAHVHAQAHTPNSYSAASRLLSFQTLSLRASSSFLKQCPSMEAGISPPSGLLGCAFVLNALFSLLSLNVGVNLFCSFLQSVLEDSYQQSP